MRTLRQIDNETMDAAKKHVADLCGTEDNYFGISKNEIIAVQANLRFSDKYREMYHLLEEIEKHLKTVWVDGTAEQNAKMTLLKKIAAV